MNPQILAAAPATLAILAITTLISLVAFSSPKLLDAMMFDVGRIRRGEWARAVSSGLIHGDPGHLFLNMASLFFIGVWLEQMIGTPAFVAFYVVSLLGGSAWTLLENWRNPSYRALGASGAVSGIVSGFALFAPFALFFGFIPAVIYAIGFIAWSAFASGRVQDGIGHGAHLGGALAGVVLVCVFWPEAVRDIWFTVADRVLS